MKRLNVPVSSFFFTKTWDVTYFEEFWSLIKENDAENHAQQTSCNLGQIKRQLTVRVFMHPCVKIP